MTIPGSLEVTPPLFLDDICRLARTLSAALQSHITIAAAAYVDRRNAGDAHYKSTLSRWVDLCPMITCHNVQDPNTLPHCSALLQQIAFSSFHTHHIH